MCCAGTRHRQVRVQTLETVSGPMRAWFGNTMLNTPCFGIAKPVLQVSNCVWHCLPLVAWEGTIGIARLATQAFDDFRVIIAIFQMWSTSVQGYWLRVKNSSFVLYFHELDCCSRALLLGMKLLLFTAQGRRWKVETRGEERRVNIAGFVVVGKLSSPRGTLHGLFEGCGFYSLCSILFFNLTNSSSILHLS